MSRVQSAKSPDSNDGGATTVATAAFAAAPTQHNCIVGHVSWQGSGNPATELTSITDNASGGSNTYTIIDRGMVNTGDLIAIATFIAQDIKSGASGLTVTANFNGSMGFRRISAHEYDSVATTGQPNAHAHSADDATFSSSTDAVTSGNGTTTVNGCTIWGVAYDEQSSTIPTVGTNYTSADSASFGAGDAWRAEDRTQTTQGAIAATFTSANGANHIGVGMLALAPSSSGGSTTTKVMTDTLVLIEQLVRWNRRQRNSVDALTLFDDPNRVIQMQMLDFGLDLTDGSIDWERFNRQSSDTLTLTDGVIQWRRLVRALNDSMTLVDSIIKSITGGGVLYTKVMSEAIEFSDGFVRWLRYRRTTNDALDVLDGFSKLIAGAGITYAKILSDSMTLADDVGNRWKFVRSQATDTLILADSTVFGAVRNRLAQDVMIVADGLMKWMRLLRQIGDDIEFSDGTVMVRRMLRTHSDQFDISDDLVRTLFLDQLQPTSFIFGIGADPFQFGAGRIL